MRKLVAVALVLITASLGAPVSVFAQTSKAAQLGTISGEAVDAGGRALVNQRVELVQSGEVVQTTTTGSHGEWTFTGVIPGDYVVRIVINGQITGVRVLVAPGQAVINALVVAPSAAAPSAAFLFRLGPLFSTIIVGTIVAAVVTTVVVVTGS